MPSGTLHLVARRRALLLLALVLLLQGPIAQSDLIDQVALVLLGVPILVIADGFLSGWCARRRPLAAVGSTTAVLFLAQELYSGLAVEWVVRSDPSPAPPEPASLLFQHLLALALAATVALVVCGVRTVRSYLASVRRLVWGGAPVVSAPPRVVVQVRRTTLAPAVAVAHFGLRSPPRAALPS